MWHAEAKAAALYAGARGASAVGATNVSSSPPCDAMPLITDDGRHCYEATAWSLVLGNAPLRRLIMSRACKLYGRLIRCFENENCNLGTHRLVSGRLQTVYDALVRALTSDLDYHTNEGGLPTRMLQAILMQHDDSAPELVISTRDDDVHELADVSLRPHGKEHTKESLGWTYQSLRESIDEDTRRRGDAYTYAGSIVNVRVRGSDHSIALVRCADGRTYQCDTTVKNAFRQLSDHCIDVTDEEALYGLSPSGSYRMPYTITSATNVFVSNAAVAAVDSACYDRATTVVFHWRNRTFQHDFLKTALVERSLQRALPDAEVDSEGMERLQQDLRDGVNPIDLRDYFYDTTHFKVVFEDVDVKKILYVARHEPKLKQLARHVASFYRTAYNVTAHHMLAEAVRYTTNEIKQQLGKSRSPHDDIPYNEDGINGITFSVYEKKAAVAEVIYAPRKVGHVRWRSRPAAGGGYKPLGGQAGRTRRTRAGPAGLHGASPRKRLPRPAAAWRRDLLAAPHGRPGEAGRRARAG